MSSQASKAWHFIKYSLISSSCRWSDAVAVKNRQSARTLSRLSPSVSQTPASPYMALASTALSTYARLTLLMATSSASGAILMRSLSLTLIWDETSNFCSLLHIARCTPWMSQVFVPFLVENRSVQKVKRAEICHSYVIALRSLTDGFLEMLLYRERVYRVNF